MYTYKNHQKQ